MTRIFISSVQSEFAEERILLKDYIESNPVLRRFFGQHAKKHREVAKNGEQVAKNGDDSDKKINRQAIEDYLISEGVRRGMRTNMLTVLTEISKDSFATIETLMGLTSLSFGGVRNALSGLKLHHLLRREGGDRGGHWVLLPFPTVEGGRL